MIHTLNPSDIDHMINELQDFGYKPPYRCPRIRINAQYDAKDVLSRIWKHCLDRIGEADYYQEIPELPSLADWLTDNHNKGLILSGKCGRGKTFFLKYVLPIALQLDQNEYVPAFYTMTEAITRHAEVMSKHVLILDDVGTEQKFNDYGTVHDTISEIIDSAEKYGKMLFISTNLNMKRFREIYGDRNCDRLHKLCRIIAFSSSDSLRRLDERRP